MRLEPGAMRELHWHATAAEWAFVDEGRVRTTVIDPQGYAETNDFEPGDIWYFPRGHGHMLECLGDKPCHFILIFDNGYFSEFGTFSITDWIGHTPKRAAGEELRPSRSRPSTGFPKKEVYFARGAMPPQKTGRRRSGLETAAADAQVSTARAAAAGRSTRAAGLALVDSTDFPISKTMTGVVLDLDPGAIANCTGTRRPTSGNTSSSGKVSVTMFGSDGR